MAQQIITGTLGAGFEVLCRHIRTHGAASGPYVVGIAGASASGKGYLAQRLKQVFPEALVISADDYFRGKEYMRKNYIKKFDDPRAVNLPLLAQDLVDLRANIIIHKPVYSFYTSETERTEICNPAPIIIVEGLFIFCDARIRAACDVKIFVEVSTHSSLIRRIVRDVGRTGRTHQQILDMFIESVYPGYQTHVLPTRAYADYVIKNDLTEEEYALLPELEIQVKASAAVAKDKMRRVLEDHGFRLKKELIKLDEFFFAEGMRAAHAAESLRLTTQYSVREDGSFVLSQDEACWLTYKTPSQDSYKRRALHVHLFANPRTTSARPIHMHDMLLGIGYQKKCTLAKLRDLFVHESDGTEITYDTCYSPDTLEHVSYLELRAGDEQVLRAWQTRLRNAGLVKGRWTGRSYREILHDQKNKPQKGGSQ